MPEPTADLPPHVERILDAARIAPSHDNMQPWRFVVEGETVSFLVDYERDRSPGNAAGRMAAIAVGAALECTLLRAGRMGSTVRFLPARGGALVTLSLSLPKRVVEADKALTRRATNRRLYDGRPLDDETFAWLQQATPALDATSFSGATPSSGPPSSSGPVSSSLAPGPTTTRTLWFGRERVRALAPVIEEAETLFYAEPRAREAALRAVRFDVRDGEEVTQGLSLGSLELSSSARMALDAMRRTPQDRLAATGAFEKMGAHARRLVESASGLCVIVARGTEPATDVAVGRCMQRAWLSLTRRGLVAQPMTAVHALEAMLEAADAGKAGDATFEGRERAAAVVAAYRAAFPGIDRGSRVALVMRVGNAPPPTALVRRLPLSDSVAAAAPAPPSQAPPASQPL